MSTMYGNFVLQMLTFLHLSYNKIEKDERSLVAFKAIYQKYKINHPTSPRREEFSFAAASVTIFDHISHMYLCTYFF
jgi:hypothetical protein